MSKTDPIKVYVRWMIRRDMAEVFSIERLCFEHWWSKDDFKAELRRSGCFAMVAEWQHRVVGYAIYDLLPKSICVLNFAVDPEFRRRRVGSQMIEKMASTGVARRSSFSVV
jgi:ribosomal-protein-alanine N-acetyltransferase